jgi:hypothetical protein
MSEIENPFRGLVGGRLSTYFDEAFGEYGRGRVRGAYDYCLLALNSTVFELKPRGKRLFEWLESLETDGKLGADVLGFARASPFLVKHDQGITDMDLSYMSTGDFQDIVRFLQLLYRSLADHGVKLANDPRGV